MLHDHGGKFDIGKEKMIEPFGAADAARHASAQAWTDKEFSGRWPGDALAARGYVVFCADALGWGERGPLTGDAQQALASNFFNLGGSMAGNMALEDLRAAGFLAAPKPALFFAGESDKLFPVASVREAYDKMVTVWRAWGASGRFEAIVRPGGHEFPREAQEYAYDWLDRQFGRPAAATGSARRPERP